MKSILQNKHTWIIFIVFTLLAIAAYIWLPNNSTFRAILFGVAVSHFAIAFVVLIIGWIIIPKKLKKRIKEIRSRSFKGILK